MRSPDPAVVGSPRIVAVKIGSLQPAQLLIVAGGVGGALIVRWAAQWLFGA